MGEWVRDKLVKKIEQLAEKKKYIFKEGDENAGYKGTIQCKEYTFTGDIT